MNQKFGKAKPQADLMTNWNLFSEFLSLGSITHLNSNKQVSLTKAELITLNPLNQLGLYWKLTLTKRVLFRLVC